MLKRIREILRSFREHIHVLSWVVRVVRAYRRFLFFILGLNIVQMLMGIFFSVYVKNLIDNAGAEQVRSRLYFYAALMLGWTALGGLLGYWSTLYYERIAFSVRKQVFHAVLRADWSRVSRMPVGDLNSRISGDAGEITDYACYTFPGLAGAVIQLCVTAVIVYSINARILTILMLGALVAAVLMLGFRLGLKPLQKQFRERDVAAASFQTELCGNLMTVKSLCREEASEARFQELQNQKVRAMRRKYRFACASDTALGMFFDLGYLLVFSWAVLNLGRGDITYGMLSMLIALEGYIQGPVNAIASSMPDFVRMLIAADRLEEVIRLDSGDPDCTADCLPGSALALSVSGLTYTYSGRETPVLRDFSCQVAQGSFAVIVGESGCGKTTLLHLILGMLIPDAGRITLTDAAGRQHPAGRAARLRMGYVPQGNTLFSGTILDNVCFGLPVDEEKARRALALADALAFVEDLPMGIRSPVDEDSRGISVGQAQRVAIARALYSDPAVLILDEATSALDRDTERRILTAIHQMPNRPTVLCVSHRESAQTFADQIIAVGSAPQG